MQHGKTRLWVLCSICLAGCAQWSAKSSGEVNSLPLPKMAPESVVLSVVFVRIPPDCRDLTQQFWPGVDEQVLPNELRRRLSANGIRCGLVSMTLPSALQEVLDQEDMAEVSDGVAQVMAGEEPVARSQRIHSRAGQEGKIVVRSNMIQRLAALTRDEDGQIHGQSLDQAQLYFAIRSFPQGDGQVQLELTPIIEHGQARSRFVGQKGVWAVDNSSRPSEVFDELKIEATLAPGQSLVLGHTELPRGLGRQFFAENGAEDLPGLLLLVRLQQTQLDDRFGAGTRDESITTALD
jgi:hypothetical protein